MVVLLINTACLAAVGSGVFWLSSRQPRTTIISPGQAAADDVAQRVPAPVPATTPAWAGAQRPEPAASAAPEASAVSWTATEKAFADHKHAEALAGFRRLLELVRPQLAEARLADYFGLRMAQCMMALGKSSDARERLESVASNSTSPRVRAAANYNLALLGAAQGSYLQARTHAYLALVSLEGLSKSLPLKTDCYFLIAKILTRKVLQTCGDDALIELPGADENAFFADLDEPALRTALQEGADRAGQVILQPQIHQVPSAEGARWDIACCQASLEDVLSQLASAAGADLQWSAVPAPVRLRPVTLSLSKASGQRICEIACGSVGLLGRFNGEQFAVHDIQNYASLKEQKDLLLEEAMSAWRRLFLRASGDARVAEGHLAVGALQECAGETVAAINEYKLTASQYDRHRVAPTALFRCAKVRIDLRDYAGAREDLLNLMYGYPNASKSQEVHLALGQATLNAGLLDEAVKAFTRLYNLELTPSSMWQASLGAGKCLYQKGDFEGAAKWLNRYVTLVKEPAASELAEAYLLLGRSENACGRTAQAARAFELSRSVPGGSTRVEAGLELARIQIGRGLFSGAMTLLAATEKEELTPDQSGRLCLLSARAYRAMSLDENAVAALRKGLAADAEGQTQCALNVELAQCLADAGELEKAHSLLTDTLGRMKAGPAAHAATCDLAEICLKLEKPQQAVTLCQELLKAELTRPEQAAAREILGRAHVQQKEYDKAAMALAGLADGSGPAKESPMKQAGVTEK